MVEPLVLQLGVVTTAQLAALGWSKWQIERAVHQLVLERIRPGWFGRGPDATALAAVRAGGCISCFSALRLRGAWVPQGSGSHVRRARHRSGASCRPFGPSVPVRSAVDDLETAVRCAFRCGDREALVVVLDSLLHRRLATMDELRSWAANAPARVRALLALLDGRAESGTESMLRLRLWQLRIGVRIQVRVLPGMRVDLLVGERLVIECDSREHHTDAAAYERDQERDRRLVARGFVVLRLSYRQIHEEWPAIERDILAIIRRGDHRFARRNQR
ncbi:type IV toxin-antitoxin system AbiEi family antitoxin domain-containing protein [Agrococcus sp. SL85]|uniref:type IV toxin-antitoxin system AbiEi family antitoxin domain-containing protein n=1 Tax=Agrococcus sp. SL85 TaxID=2995141 RepID=UPI00226D05D5|nr:type IV toxin-antitoxin system AbiEi family antitoxin domain-containing protein [Agrococcus sp. SL85]WAC66595.1 type IV toxin-antitoxin system AbiEi family antitoxin domain-containing protein [Agrococcus sp. SL85]